MIIDSDAGRETVEASLFKTDEHNNLCIYINNRCTRVYAAGTWSYAEVETDG